MNKQDREKQKRRRYRDRKFLKAVKEGNYEETRCGLDSGAKVNTFTHQNGKTALLEACSRGYYEIAELLIERGADLSTTDHKGRSALRLAANERIRGLLRKHKCSDYSSSDLRSYY